MDPRLQRGRALPRLPPRTIRARRTAAARVRNPAFTSFFPRPSQPVTKNPSRALGPAPRSPAPLSPPPSSLARAAHHGRPHPRQPPPRAPASAACRLLSPARGPGTDRTPQLRPGAEARGAAAHGGRASVAASQSALDLLGAPPPPRPSLSLAAAAAPAAGSYTRHRSPRSGVPPCWRPATACGGARAGGGPAALGRICPVARVLFLLPRPPAAAHPPPPTGVARVLRPAAGARLLLLRWHVGLLLLFFCRLPTRR